MNVARNPSWPLAALLFFSASAFGQDRLPSPPPPASSAASTPANPAVAATTDASDQAAPAADEGNFKPEELEQMLAAIALYPDSLLSQVLMASTYPIEVVEAERWMKANTQLKGDALAKELEKKQWDPSVKSLVNFPDVLSMMSENLTTTTKIGDAFIGQQEEVMQTVQKLRAKAKEAGNLESNQQQNVTVQDSGGTQVIVVESSSPEVIYVPQYNPTVVYGTWPYPAYQPYPYYPPGYVASPVLAFGVGVAVGAAWGYAWGNCNWGGNDIDIDINRNTNINNNIDRSKYKNSGNRSFKHDPSHRQGAAYRNQASANKVGAGASSNRASQARNDYRGKAEAGRSDISRGGADSFKNNSRAGGAGSTRAPQATPRTSGGSAKGGALNDARGGGTAAKQASSRGSSSRQSSPSASSRSSGSRSSSAGSRSSSGASRSGASRGGGGRGGGGRR